MFVQHILNTKNNANLITVPLKTDLSGAISILAARKIGVVIVSETGKNALGILSERDIIRALSEAGTNALSAPVEQFMSRDVVTCSPQTSADDVFGADDGKPVSSHAGLGRGCVDRFDLAGRCGFRASARDFDGERRATRHDYGALAPCI